MSKRRRFCGLSWPRRETLERALAAFFLDTHAANGYTEILPPFLNNTQALTGEEVS